MVWDIDPVLLRLGPVQVRYYGLLFVATLLGGWQIWRWQMLRGGYSEQQAERFFWWGVGAVIIGSRLGHMFFYEWDRVVADPLSILYIWQGGLASHGATIGLMLVLYIYSRAEKIPVAEVTDRFAMAAALGATLVRIGNFFNSEIVGRKTDVPWAVKFPRSAYDYRLPLELVPARHPSQLYEAAMGATILGILYLVDRRLGEKRPRGLLSALFLLLYFSGRFAVEFVKEFQTLDPNRSPLTMGQWLSLPFFLMGVIWLSVVLKQARQTA